MPPVPTGSPAKGERCSSPNLSNIRIIYIIHFINSQLTYGPGLQNTTPWSWGLTRASTQTVPHGHGLVPCGAQQPYMAAMVGPGCQRKLTRTPLLRHRCLVSNLHRVRTMQYNQTLHPPMGPFSRASTTARAAVDILDTIVRLGQHGTRRWLTGMNGVRRPVQY